MPAHKDPVWLRWSGGRMSKAFASKLRASLRRCSTKHTFTRERNMQSVTNWALVITAARSPARSLEAIAAVKRQLLKALPFATLFSAVICAAAHAQIDPKYYYKFSTEFRGADFELDIFNGGTKNNFTQLTKGAF